MFDDEPKFKVGESVFIPEWKQQIIGTKIKSVIVYADGVCLYSTDYDYPKRYEENYLFKTFGEARQEAIELLTTKNK